MNTDSAAHDQQHDDIATMSYSAAQRELDRIVAKMEESRPDIDALVGLVERSSALLAHCRDLVATTRAKVTVITAEPDNTNAR
jgi:exodeoxyribonuclease VII small subunit